MNILFNTKGNQLKIAVESPQPGGTSGDDLQQKARIQGHGGMLFYAKPYFGSSILYVYTITTGNE